MQVRALVLAMPTLLNLQPTTAASRLATLRRILAAWKVRQTALSPTVLGMALTASPLRLSRLEYVAFLGQMRLPGSPRAGTQAPAAGKATKLSLSTVLAMPQRQWDRRFPRFDRWRRRQARRLAPPPSEALAEFVDWDGG